MTVCRACSYESMTKQWCAALEPASEQRAFRNDGSVALGAGRDHADLDLQMVRDEAQVVERGLRQLAGIFCSVGRLVPPRERLVLRRHLFVFLGECGHFLDRRALVPIADADLNFTLRIENVELG